MLIGLAVAAGILGFVGGYHILSRDRLTTVLAGYALYGAGILAGIVVGSGCGITL